MILLIATTAIGFGVAGATLPGLIGMEREEAVAFPGWLGARIDELIEAVP